MKRVVVVLLLAIVGGMVLLSRSVMAGPPPPAHAPVWQNPPPGNLVSQSSPNGALTPSIRYSSNGSQIIITYARQMSGSENDNDPFYSISTDNGLSWSPPAPIFTSSGLNSIQPVAEYRGSTAHAVWVEEVNDGTQRLLVASRGGTIFAPPIPIVQTTIPGNPLIDPEIDTNGSQLHVVWAQDFPTQIRHARSIDGGQTWLVTTVNPLSGIDGRLPDVAVNSNGVVHVVWEQDATGGITSDIYYAQGTFNGTTMVWSTPFRISALVDFFSSKQPTIVVRGSQVQVAYTNLYAQTEPAPDLQNIYFTRCFSSCTNIASWTAPQIVSGEFLVVNSADPFYITPDMAYDPVKNNTHIYFHGAALDSSNQYETIWGINRVDEWSTGGRDQATNPAQRSKNPSITIYGCWLQMAYEQYDGNLNQIYHMRGILPCEIYLPIMRK